MVDYINDDNDKKRNYERSNSTISFTNISKKIRRGSFFLHWDSSLQVTNKLKKLEKSRLCLSQNDFSALEYQLYSSRCLLAKKDKIYTYAGRNVTFNNDVYIKLIRYMTVWNVLNLCIWRYHNEIDTVPSEEMQDLFDTMYEVEDDQPSLVVKETAIKLTDNYTLRRVFWTVKQRQAAANTRDHFLRGFGARYPMMSDLRWTQTNNNMVREFITGLLRADVEVSIVHDICYAQLVKEKTGKEKTGKVIRHNSLDKTKETMPTQRSSITDFTPVKEEVVAAIRLQRAYRKRLVKLKDAVRIIERFWEPFRLENAEIRLEIQQENEANLQRIEERENNEDLFKYDELAQEIKDDYNTVRRPEPRPPSYWMKVIAILALPIFLSTLIETMPAFGLLIVLYVLGQMMTYYRKNWYITWIQTLALWSWTVFMLNEAFFFEYTAGWRIGVWIAIVVFGGQRWMVVFFVTMVIRIALTFVYDIFAIQPMEYGIFVYDAYCIATIAAASRQGKPIEMLQKVMINIVMLVIIAASGAMAWFVACFHLGD